VQEWLGCHEPGRSGTYLAIRATASSSVVDRCHPTDNAHRLGHRCSTEPGRRENLTGRSTRAGTRGPPRGECVGAAAVQNRRGSLPPTGCWSVRLNGRAIRIRQIPCVPVYLWCSIVSSQVGPRAIYWQWGVKTQLHPLHQRHLQLTESAWPAAASCYLQRSTILPLSCLHPLPAHRYW